MCQRVRAEDIIPMLTHLCKEQVMQRFLKGPIYFPGTCEVETGCNGTRRRGAGKVGYLHFKEGALAQKSVQQVHNCIIYLHPLTGDEVADSTVDSVEAVDIPPARA